MPSLRTVLLFPFMLIQSIMSLFFTMLQQAFVMLGAIPMLGGAIKFFFRIMPPLTCFTSIILTIVYFGLTMKGGTKYGSLEQKTWYVRSKMMDRGASWADNKQSVILKYREGCATPENLNALLPWPPETFKDQSSFCNCVGKIVCDENIQEVNEKVPDGVRVKLVECALRDTATKAHCGGNCGVRSFNIGYLQYMWNWISLVLALEIFYVWVAFAIDADTKNMGLLWVIYVIAFIIYFIPLMVTGDKGDTAIFIAMPFIYFVVKFLLFAIGAMWISKPYDEMACWSFSMICNETYLFTVPIGVAILYASGFMLDGQEAIVAILASVLVPFTQMLATLPDAMGRHNGDGGFQKVLLVTCSLLVTLSILMPQFQQYRDTCTGAQPQFWNHMSTWGIWTAILLNSIYPLLEIVFRTVFALLFRANIIEGKGQDLYSPMNIECLYVASFFVLMDLITRGQLNFDPDKLGCLLAGRC